MKESDIISEVISEDRKKVRSFLDNLDKNAIVNLINLYETSSSVPQIISDNKTSIYNTISLILDPAELAKFVILNPTTTYDVISCVTRQAYDIALATPKSSYQLWDLNWARNNPDLLVNNGLFEEIGSNSVYREKIVDIIQHIIEIADREAQKHIIEQNNPIGSDSEKEQNYNKEKNDSIRKVSSLVDKTIKDYQMTDYIGLAKTLNEKEFLTQVLSDQVLSDEKHLNLLKDVYTKYRIWAPSESNDPKINKNYKNLVISATDLLSQEHVAEALTPLVDGKLIDHVFDLPSVTKEVKTYLPLVKSLAEDKPQFQALFASMLDKTAGKGVEDLMSKTLDYTNTITTDPTINDKFKSVVIEATDLLSQKHVTEALTPLVDGKLIDHVFDLPSVTKEVKTYLPLVKSLAEDKVKFQKLFADVISDKEDLQPFIDKMMDFVLQEGDDPKISQAYQISLIKLLKPNIIESFVDVANEGVINEILKLSATKPIESPLDRTNKITPISRAEGIKKFLSDILKLNISTVLHEAINNITQHLITAEDKPDQIPSVSKSLSEMVSGLSDNDEFIKKIKNDIKFKTRDLGTIDSKSGIGELLRAFDIKAPDIAQISDKILTKKGLESIAQYLKKPTHANIFNILYQTETLSFVASHCLSFVKNKMVGMSAMKEKSKKPMYKTNNSHKKNKSTPSNKL